MLKHQMIVLYNWNYNNVICQSLSEKIHIPNSYLNYISVEWQLSVEEVAMWQVANLNKVVRQSYTEVLRLEQTF